MRKRYIKKECASRREYFKPICIEYNKKTYLISGIIGNSSLLASVGEDGKIYRLWWPNIDIPQHIDDVKAGIYIFSKSKYISWLDNLKEKWVYNQYYEKDTNILVSEATNSMLNIFIRTTDFAVPDKDILVRNFTIINTGTERINLQFIHYTSMKIEENPLYNATTFMNEEDSLVHYRHDYAFCISSPVKSSGYSTTNALKDAEDGKLNGGNSVLNSRGAISYYLSIKPNEIKEIPLYFACGHSLEDSVNKIREAKIHSPYNWFEITKNEDYKFLIQAKQIYLNNEEIETMYKRSLLVQKLLCDKESGSIVAAPEVDETYSKCGGYNYCWGRDGVYIARSFQAAGLLNYTRSFYLWTITAQDKDGSWQQRHYHDGKLAPSWGFQVDEGGSILWGMWEYYKETKDIDFLKQVWKTVKKGAEFLVGFRENQNNLPLNSFDLWEERIGQHAYSCAAVYGGLIGASSIAKELGYEKLGLKWNIVAQKIKNSIERLFWSEKNQQYYRTINEEVSKEIYEIERKKGNSGYIREDEKGYLTYYINYDSILDTSLLGVVVPFGVFSPFDDKMKKTADLIEKNLWNQTVGGLKRYENDKYIGGNPWIITTLWLALFRIEQKQYEKAKKLLYWVLKRRTCLGLLSEQIHKEKGTPAWVIPLNWSHAMFISVVLKLIEASET